MGRLNKVTLEDIANEVEMSRFLVCRALTGKPGVNEETRQLIEKTAARLGYKGKKSKPANPEIKLFALLVDEIEAKRVFWTRIIGGIEAAARNSGYNMLLRAVSQEDVERREIPSMITEGSVKGVLITGNLNPEYVACFEKTNCQVVLVDNYIPVTSHDAVLIDDWQGSYLATKYLIELGHTKIGYAGQTVGHWSWTQRFHGFLAALYEQGLTYDNRFGIAQERGLDIWNHDYIDREVKRIKSFPTAWVCNNDKTAHFLIQSLNQHGYKVPDDVSVSGFDDLPEEYPEIPIAVTSVRVLGQEIGSAAFEHLTWRINNPEAPPRRITIGVQLIKGITTGPPADKL